eukprot:GFUD01028927.1.p1 GENE.GFUD01028927.1~~GFUD01028927.1.p1  ORF type:complete len:507 (+),score=66.69 GFUD01028927.1:38-1558(+)
MVSPSIIWIIIPFLLLAIFLTWRQKFKKWSHLPGSWWSFLEFVILSVYNPNSPLLLRRLYRKYQQDGLCFLPLFKIPLLLVGDFSKLKCLCSHPGSQGRFIDPNSSVYKFFHDFRLQQPGRISGVLLSQGNTWKEQRQFMVKTFSTLGLRNSRLEEIIFKDVENLCHCLREKNENPLQVVGLFNMFSILWNLTTGENTDYDDTKLQSLRNGLHDMVSFFGTPAVLFAINCPWITKTFPSLTKLKQQKKFYVILSNAMQDLIDTHKKDLDVNNPKDFIDYYLVNMANNENGVDIEDQEEKLRTLIIDIFMNGESSTASVLSFGFLFLVRNPEVQKMVQEEIDSILGKESPTLEHRKIMPYTQATIMEVLRCADIAPLDFRCTTEDVSVDGIIIPQNTYVCNIVTEVMKGSYWKEGESFNPGRFLDASGKITPDERLIPFLVGKRSCPGQNLSNMQLFLYLTRILQLFTVHPETEGIMPEDTFVPGVPHASPLPFKLRFCSRNVVLEK